METILIVDDDKDMRFLLSEILKNEGYKTRAVEDSTAALREINHNTFDLTLLDFKLPNMDGLQLLEKIKQINPDIIVIMLTAYGEINRAVRAMKLGAFDYITKPFNNEELILVVKKALETQYLNEEVRRLRKKLREKDTPIEFIGNSPKVKQLFKQVKLVAPTNMTVVLQGESGTGKELIAHLIHQQSLRKDNPFIVIDCGAIPETLMESELLGYERGAFTGADRRKTGKIEEANKGTLFLDEIANLSDQLQKKVLRIIEEKRLRRLGGKEDLLLDVRLVAATNLDLVRLVQEGKFRNDLFQRLNEFPINLPPLRERKEDIPLLANYFLDKTNKELGKKIKGFSPEALQMLLNYDWPGNVRELKNLISRAVLLAELEEIKKVNLFSSQIKAEAEVDWAEALNINRTETSFKDALQKVEKYLIKKALLQANSNKTKAAEILQINRKALYRKMKNLNLLS
ncbi:MAG: sigma-54 dependent transcriptional regulator [Atribacterota bacterium]|nr:sigma-54 dependent transcriptional regulator [Atribacterota bacterium]